MQALVLNDDMEQQVAMSVALLKRGFQVVTAASVDHAMAYADLGVIDLVVMTERPDGRLSHPVALSAELRNPQVTTMLLTPRNDAEVEELYELLPSLYCLLGPELPAELVATMAVAGVTGRVAPPVAPTMDAREEGCAEEITEVSDAPEAPMAEEEGPSEAVEILAGIMARAKESLGTDAERSKEKEVAA